MKILITSGGTTEPIDAVRGITNHATGRLGQLLAQLFLDKGHQVTLVTSPGSYRPEKHKRLKLIEVSTVNSLQNVLEHLVKDHQVFIHSMAVSDYSPVYMTDLEDVMASKDLSQLLKRHNHQGKISSSSDYQVLFLKKTPKLISLVKKWNPDIRLIGFKLLVNVPKEQLLQVARTSLHKNQADLIVANDLYQIKQDQHQAYLVSAEGYQTLTSKPAIAQAIYERVISNDKNHPPRCQR
ncbi:phosphopantothenate--cysteine ligase [Streptococcus cuniculipharyngis]|uniref:Phosphopantothenate--cysteine ligase n=1 Tax=Streptococcus cuniculipharyngis TaxID=1562651 RepID=A0A5C5SDJ8_9STRE|nr:phosphopantothenate--cysteine ligase [Streptococcus cuniculipharyngis]TWS98819.1 phosphopantothenate--cysteine ligase [Streptococcus cuniculipharyngis]